MSSTVLMATPSLLKEMEAAYQTCFTSSFPPYSLFSARSNGTVITAYKSGKVLFQGAHAESEAGRWKEKGAETSDKEKKASSASALPKGFDQWSVIGSDEVGNGSYFGPLTVVAAYVDQSQLALLKELGVKDSKNLSDKQIIAIAKDLVTFLPYSSLTVWPEKYNQIQPSMSQGKMKALLHNQVLLHAAKKISPQKPDAILIDQFAQEKTYFNYLTGEKEIMNQNVYFATKGESRHLAVAAASIIARYSFLKGLDECSQLAGIPLPSGAGAQSDVAAARVLKKGGLPLLGKVAKLHFANTEKAKKIAGYK